MFEGKKREKEALLGEVSGQLSFAGRTFSLKFRGGAARTERASKLRIAQMQGGQAGIRASSSTQRTQRLTQRIVEKMSLRKASASFAPVRFKLEGARLTAATNLLVLAYP